MQPSLERMQTLRCCDRLHCPWGRSSTACVGYLCALFVGGTVLTTSFLSLTITQQQREALWLINGVLELISAS